jgi:hypothetical protein
MASNESADFTSGAGYTVSGNHDGMHQEQQQYQASRELASGTK